MRLPSPARAKSALHASGKMAPRCAADRNLCWRPCGDGRHGEGATQPIPSRSIRADSRGMSWFLSTSTPPLNVWSQTIASVCPARDGVTLFVGDLSSGCGALSERPILPAPDENFAHSSLVRHWASTRTPSPPPDLTCPVEAALCERADPATRTASARRASRAPRGVGSQAVCRAGPSERVTLTAGEGSGSARLLPCPTCRSNTDLAAIRARLTSLQSQSIPGAPASRPHLVRATAGSWCRRPKPCLWQALPDARSGSDGCRSAPDCSGE